MHEQDHVAKEKAIQTMSAMSSAQIVSGSSGINAHTSGIGNAQRIRNNMSPSLVGHRHPLVLHATTPVSFPEPVSPSPLGRRFSFLPRLLSYMCLCPISNFNTLFGFVTLHSGYFFLFFKCYLGISI